MTTRLPTAKPSESAQLQVALTTEEPVVVPDHFRSHFYDYGECVYCNQPLNHYVHAWRHFVKWHLDVKTFWRSYIYFDSKWVFVRNFSKTGEMTQWREKQRQRQLATCVVLTTRR